MLRFSSLITLATFQMLHSHMGLVAIVFDGADKEYFHHHGKFHWSMLL